MTDTLTSIPLTGPINLLVRLGHGCVTVTARDDLAVASVRLTPRDPAGDVLDRITVEMRGPTLAVVGPRQGGIADLVSGRRPHRDAVDAEIEVPTGTALKITTASADIRVDGRCGGADVATGSAEIVLDRVDGELRLRYGSGTSRVRSVTGAATLRSGSGNAVFGEVGGPLQATFGSGRLDIDTSYGGVRSRAGSGDAHIARTYGDVDFGSGSGQVTVGLPAGLSTRLDVTTGSGRVHSDLPIEDVPASGKSITVRARTGSGNVRLFRAA
jgi:hypothetical protein